MFTLMAVALAIASVPDGSPAYLADVGDPVGQRPAAGFEGPGSTVRGPGDRRERPAGAGRTGDVLRARGPAEERAGLRGRRGDGDGQDGPGRVGGQPEAGADGGGG